MEGARRNGTLNKALSTLLAVVLVMGLNPTASYAAEMVQDARGGVAAEAVQDIAGDVQATDGEAGAVAGQDAVSAADALVDIQAEDSADAAQAADADAQATEGGANGQDLIALMTAGGSATTQDATATGKKMSDVKPGKYTVSANLVVPGQYNTVLKDVDAYATNPDNPLGTTDADPNNGGEGLAATHANAPVMGVENNATLEVAADGTRTIVLNVPNPVFTIQGIDGCSNATAEVTSTINGSYGLKTSRINQVKFTLDDADLVQVTESVRGGVGDKNNSTAKEVQQTQAVYTFTDCKEHPTILFQDWAVPLELRVDVAGCLDGSALQKTPVDKPVAKEGLYERFAYQKGVVAGEGYTLSGAFQAWRAGTYTATATLNDGYVWSDGTSDPVTISWTINVPTAIAKPAVSNNDALFYYDGEEHGLDITQNGSTDLVGLSITGEAKATKVGYYSVSIEPAYGYKWEGLNSSYAYNSLDYTYEIAPIDIAVSANSPLVVGIDDSQTVELPVTCLKRSSDAGFVIMTDDEVAKLGITTKGIAANRTLTEVSGLGFTLPDDAVYVGGFDWELSSDALPEIEGYHIYAALISGQVRAYYLPTAAPSPTQVALAETGSEISYTDVIKGVDFSQYEVSGDLSATQPGTYEITLKPKANHRWAGTQASKVCGDINAGTEGKTIEWTVLGKVAKPTATEGLTYTGSAQQGVADNAAYTLSGDVTATNAGAYTTTVKLKPGFVWADGSSSDVEVTWNIDKATLTAAYVGEAVAYGDQPSLAVEVTGFKGADSADSIDGYAAPAVQAPADMKMGESYELTPAGGNAGKNYTFAYEAGVLKVGPKGSVSVPGIAASFTYNGKEQQFMSVDSGEHYVVGGTNAAINAGSYKATLTLEDGYVWADGTTDPKVYTWSIKKAVLTVAYVSETVEANGTPAGNVQVTGFVNGETPTTAAGYVAPTVTMPATLEAGKAYELVPAGGAADNYEFAYNAGTLTVKAKADDAGKDSGKDSGNSGKDDGAKGDAGNAGNVGNASVTGGSSTNGSGSTNAAMAQTGDAASTAAAGAAFAAALAGLAALFARRRVQ